MSNTPATIPVADPNEAPRNSQTDGTTVVFDAPFSDASQWGVNTTAYPQDTSMGHPGDHKLDRLSGSSTSEGSSFSATRSGNVWDTDLMTTENTEGGFKVRTGDTVSARVTLNDPQGAWPALWTWNKDLPNFGEVDLFEYHSSHPNLLEFWNKVGGGHMFADNAIKPGEPFDLRVDLNQDAVVWYINGVKTYSGSGLPADWSAYLIANLSVADGSMSPHAAPAPEQSQMQGMTMDSLTVSR